MIYRDTLHIDMGICHTCRGRASLIFCCQFEPVVDCPLEDQCAMAAAAGIGINALALPPGIRRGGAT